MIGIVLGVHIAAAIIGFILSGILSVGVVRQADYAALSPTFWRAERVMQ